MSADKADIAAMREEGDLIDYIKSLTGRPPKQRQAEPTDEKPCYHIRRPGAWPCGTAPSGPTPAPCAECPPPPRRVTAPAGPTPPPHHQHTKETT